MSILILNRLKRKRFDYVKALEGYQGNVYMYCDESIDEDYKDIFTTMKFPNITFNSRVELEAVELYKKTQFSNILVLEEGDILRAARMREYLGIQGQLYKSALYFRDKFLMKELLRDNQIKVANQRKVRSILDILDFSNQYGWPIVLKPRDGMFSVETYVFHDLNELKMWSEKKDCNGLLVESFVTGDMYHVDGIIVNGEIVLISPSRYINTCLDSTFNTGISSEGLEPDCSEYKPLVEITKKILDILPSPQNFTFHAEYFWHNGEPVFCEIASRTGGVFVPELIKQKFKIDINRECIRSQIGLSVTYPCYEDKQIYGAYCIPPKKGILLNYPQKVPFDECVNYECRGIIGDDYSQYSMCTGRYAMPYVSGKNVQDLRKNAKKICDYIIDNTKWDLSTH